MRSYLVLALLSLAVAIYSLAVLKRFNITSEEHQGPTQSIAFSILVVWLILGLINIVYYLIYWFERVKFATLHAVDRKMRPSFE